MAVLISMRISLNFEGVSSEIGKYPFAKILIANPYVHSWVINSLYSAKYFSCTVLSITVKLWSNDENLMNLHKVI